MVVRSLYQLLVSTKPHLNSEGCDVLSLVDVVVQSGGEGEEAVCGDEQLRHQVSIERK